MMLNGSMATWEKKKRTETSHVEPQILAKFWTRDHHKKLTSCTSRHCARHRQTLRDVEGWAMRWSDVWYGCQLIDFLLHNSMIRVKICQNISKLGTQEFMDGYDMLPPKSPKNHNVWGILLAKPWGRVTDSWASCCWNRSQSTTFQGPNMVRNAAERTAPGALRHQPDFISG